MVHRAQLPWLYYGRMHDECSGIVVGIASGNKQECGCVTRKTVFPAIFEPTIFIVHTHSATAALVGNGHAGYVREKGEGRLQVGPAVGVDAVLVRLLACATRA